MERRMTQVAGVIVAVIVLLMLMNAVMSPADRVRAALAAELARVPEGMQADGVGDRDFAALSNPILDKPTLWQELVPVAPVAVPKPVTPAALPPQAPDLSERLAGLVMVPGQIGEHRMRVITPEAPDGRWMKIGDTYNGCALTSFTREEAVFRYYWEAGKKELTVTLPRPLR